MLFWVYQTLESASVQEGKVWTETLNVMNSGSGVTVYSRQAETTVTGRALLMDPWAPVHADDQMQRIGDEAESA